MHEVFISYSSKEYPEAETVRRTLESNGISCWMAPHSIPGGSNYTREIPIAIRECQVFVLILSEKAQESHWVLKELDTAVGHGKIILPFMLKSFTLGDEFGFLLSGTQWYTAYPDADAELEKMIARIREITGLPKQHFYQPHLPKSRPRPEPLPESKDPPEPQYGVYCPACGTSDVAPIAKETASYSAAEQASFLLALPAALAAGLAALIIFMFLGTPVLFCAAAAAVIAAILTIRALKIHIRRKRIRNHIRVCGIRCRVCAKKFRITAPDGEIFPWDT